MVKVVWAWPRFAAASMAVAARIKGFVVFIDTSVLVPLAAQFVFAFMAFAVRAFTLSARIRRTKSASKIWMRMSVMVFHALVAAGVSPLHLKSE